MEGNGTPRSPTLLLAGYSVALFLGSLIGLPFFLLRLALRRRWREGLFERLTIRLPPPRGARRRVWMHAASAGEMAAVVVVARALERRRPDLEVVLSSTTTSGRGVAERELPGRAVFLQPLDFGVLVRRALKRVDPALLVLVELELWPRLSDCAARAGVPVVVANGRISERSARRYAAPWVRRLVGMDRVAMFAVQNDEYRDRLRRLGVAERRVVVTGNVKADAPARTAPPSLRASLGIASTDRVVVAGSTHPGEVALIVQAVDDAARRLGAPIRTIVAPRHKDRIPVAERELADAGRRSQRLTEVRAGAPLAANSTLVVDTMGELVDFYAIAEVAIVGGSLVPGIGGHNVFEPALCGVPAIVGPWRANVRSDAQFLESIDALSIVEPESLTTRLVELLGAGGVRSETIRERLARARGAAERTVDHVLQHCGPESTANSRITSPEEQALERKRDG